MSTPLPTGYCISSRFLDLDIIKLNYSIVSVIGRIDKDHVIVVGAVCKYSMELEIPIKKEIVRISILNKMNISLIVATDKNLGIGKDGIIPWNLKPELKYFSEKIYYL